MKKWAQKSPLGLIQVNSGRKMVDSSLMTNVYSDKVTNPQNSRFLLGGFRLYIFYYRTCLYKMYSAKSMSDGLLGLF
jgi:hypothetical protein